MNHEDLVHLSDSEKRHRLRSLVESEASRIARDPEEYEVLLQAGLRRLYSLNFSTTRSRHRGLDHRCASQDPFLHCFRTACTFAP